MSAPGWHLRVARPASDLHRTTEMYCRGIGLRVVERFRDHDGFDGVILAGAATWYHLEFTLSHTHPVHPRPTVEDLIVFYVPDAGEWTALCARMLAAGFRRVTSLNPYWERSGRTFEDADGYRVVLQNGAWME